MPGLGAYMMNMGDLIARDGIMPTLAAKTKKQALHDMAERASAITGLAVRDVFDTLLQRERLCSTGLGHGIAIPHVRFAALTSSVGLLGRVTPAIEFDALDGEPVDLIFMLLSPEHAGGDHLKALARISRLARQPGMLDRLRSAKDAVSLYAVVSDSTAHAA
jgi:nitrogen PTS system EIIA component